MTFLRPSGLIAGFALLATFTANASSESTGAATLKLSSADYATSSNADSVTIAVSRIGATAGAASVSYATANGSATAGRDYQQTGGVITWANGEAAKKAITVPLLGGSGGNHFVVVLWGAKNAQLSSPTTAVVSIAAASPPPLGQTRLSIRVQGDHFIDADSVPIQLRGVNVSALEFVAAQGWDPADPWGGDAPNFKAIKSWKSNTVRFPLNEASWLGYRCVDAAGVGRDPDPGHNYQATVKKAVSDATAAGLYVILDLHWSAPKNFCPLAQNPMADRDNSVNFWTSIAGTFKTSPNVMFELFNEPYFFWLSKGEVDWDVLMHGGTITEYVTGSNHRYTSKFTWQAAGMQQLLDAVRQTGATNVVLISGVSWTQDLSQWVAHKPTDPEDQIAAVWHAYPNSDGVGNPQAALPKFGSIAYAWTKSVLKAGYPILITEFGDHNASGTEDAPFASKLLPWADENGASYTGWSWNPWPAPNNVLIKDETGLPTDGYGAYTRAHYVCVATGSSNCP